MSETYESPTLRRRRLAAELRKLREAAGLTHDEVARRLEWSRSKLSRIENAQWKRPSPRDVRDLLDLYGVEDQARRDALTQLARDARQKGWWTQFDDVFTGSYVGFEDAASQIRSYEAELVPGLLQTEHYARAAIAALRPEADDDALERRVAARLKRQELLDRSNAPRLWVVLNEAVLHRGVGGRYVMRDQLDALHVASRRPNVTLQVVPYAVGAHAGMEGSFVLLSFPDPTDPDVGYLEGLMGSLYLEEPEEIDRYTLAFDHVRAIAATPDESRTLIAAAAKETTS
ncbi:MAG: helix-turn-helix domain-containing protein [Nocardioidaceae bacterium]